jgi:hypothetical protein
VVHGVSVKPASFQQIFRSRAKAARRWLLIRALLTGLSASATLLALCMFIRWVAPEYVPALLNEGPTGTGPSTLALFGLVLLAVLPVGATWLSEPGDSRLALYFDDRLRSAQCIVSAVEDVSSPFAEYLRSRAGELLAGAPADRLRPRVLRPVHAALPLAALAVGALLRVPAPVPTKPPLPAGSRTLHAHALSEFEPLLDLYRAPGLNEADEALLRQLSAQARELERELTQGVSQRRAMSDLARMQDTISERLRASSPEAKDTGMQAAIAALRDNPDTVGAAEALRRGDLSKFDAEMRRLSSAEERASRHRARQALERARDATQAYPSPMANRLLSEQLSLFDSRAEAAEQIRELLRLTQLQPDEARAIEGNQRAAPPTNRAPSDEGPSVTLEAARKRELAQRLQAGLERGTFDFTTKELDDMQSKANIDGQDSALPALANALSRHSALSDSARRHQALLNADRAVARLQHTLAERPFPLPSAHAALGDRNTYRKGQDEGEASSGRSDEPGEHAGSTDAVGAMELRAKTNQPLDFRDGVFTSSKGRSNTGHTRGVRTANQGEFRAVGPTQIESVQRSEIPSEYREQVSRYFSGD